jgi:serine/threonine protein phosphatase 1
LATIRSYVRDERLPSHDFDALQLALRRAMPPAHESFLAEAPYWHVEGDYFLVHAGVRPGIPLEVQDPYDLLWIRGEFIASSADFGKIVVHGHTIVRSPDVRRNRIGIDTGAFFTGRLTALVAEGARRGFLST